MSNIKFRQVIYIILIIIWMLAVFWFSNQKGEDSQKTSNNVTKKIIQIVTYNMDISEKQQEMLIEKTDIVVRKMAHFTIYVLGGILIYSYINTYNLNSRKKIIIAIIISITYVISDEFHQHFVSDRSPSIIDICIDSLGVISGVMLTYLINKVK